MGGRGEEGKRGRWDFFFFFVIILATFFLYPFSSPSLLLLLITSIYIYPIYPPLSLLSSSVPSILDPMVSHTPVWSTNYHFFHILIVILLNSSSYWDSLYDFNALVFLVSSSNSHAIFVKITHTHKWENGILWVEMLLKVILNESRLSK